MNYAPQYRGYINVGERVSKTNIRPYGIYKISTYKYADGDRTTLRGTEETLIFVTGIYQRKVSALKLSNIQPLKFIQWFKKIAGTNSYRGSSEENVRLDELKTPFDMGGNRIYDSFIKTNVDFVAKGAAYRTYNLDGIQYATEVFLKKNILEQYYG